MKLVDKTISKDDLKKLSEGFAGGLVKAVVDIKKEIMIIDAPSMLMKKKNYLI